MRLSEESRQGQRAAGFAGHDKELGFYCKHSGKVWGGLTGNVDMIKAMF